MTGEDEVDRLVEHLSYGRGVLKGLSFVTSSVKKLNPRASDQTVALMAASHVVQSVPPATLKQGFDAASTCTCLTRSSIVYLHIGIFTLFSRHSLLRHKRDCPQSLFGQNRKGIVGARLQLGAFLSCILEVTASCSIGAGANSLNNSVNWKNLVPRRQSPVRREFFRFADWLGNRERSSSPEDVLSELVTMHNNVIALYQDQKASIYDIDELGNNHLQVRPAASAL